MPTYTAKCETCGLVADYASRVDDRDITPNCHGPMLRQLTAAMGFVRGGGGDWDPYICPMTDAVVTSARQQKYIFEKEDVVDSRELKSQWAKKRIDMAETKAELKRIDDAIPAAAKAEAMKSAPIPG